MGKWCSAGHYRAIFGVELTASSRVIVCYSQLAPAAVVVYGCGGSQTVGWLVEAWDFTNTHVQGHGEREVLPKTIYCSQVFWWGEAFEIPADGVCQWKYSTGVYKNYIPQVFVKYIYLTFEGDFHSIFPARVKWNITSTQRVRLGWRQWMSTEGTVPFGQKILFAI